MTWDFDRHQHFQHTSTVYSRDKWYHIRTEGIPNAGAQVRETQNYTQDQHINFRVWCNTLQV